jgi:hypothetical protein
MEQAHCPFQEEALPDTAAAKAKIQPPAPKKKKKAI